MNNILDKLMNNPLLNDMKNKATETIGGMGNMPNLGNLSNTSAGDALKQTFSGSNLGGSLGGILGAGALGGLLGVFMSGKTVKKAAKGALVVGGTAAVGALAWQFYQKWSQNSSVSVNAEQSANTLPQATTTPNRLPVASPESSQELAQVKAQTASLLIEAMVFAARADGHIDDNEKHRIHDTIEKLYPGQDVAPLLNELLNKALDPTAIAAKISNKEEGYDIYKISCLIVDIDHFMERSYLDALATSLNIPAELKFQLEQEADAVKKQMYA